MTVLRIVPNIATDSIEEVGNFYSKLFDLNIVMDHGWIVTLASDQRALTQIGIATEGGSGAAVPDISIEVDDVDEIYQRAVTGGHAIVYGPADEPWGVRRFFIRDPSGKLLNILSHAG
ncbi:putative enzyme related to lactoylglutathione lyase [Rhizobium sp. BK529]|uniref:VOC family protein n=1 Tax=unclassified Rhizobium TaxID=2613769 RepID=UPI001046D58C|nr:MULTISPECIES: VOC family protein [unclassified Rhizobium]MBB3591675.1 putative enzyme related to lactoylglutathione lyase [Rhizobium sp. BK529]TCS08377.1 putative enzyme related to lactoylglutathione lyase [Rhizobium sp. BK418]